VLSGGQANELIDLDLRSVEHVNAVAQSRDYSKFNPGYTIASYPAKPTSRRRLGALADQ